MTRHLYLPTICSDPTLRVQFIYDKVEHLVQIECVARDNTVLAYAYEQTGAIRFTNKELKLLPQEYSSLMQHLNYFTKMIEEGRCV